MGAEFWDLEIGVHGNGNPLGSLICMLQLLGKILNEFTPWDDSVAMNGIVAGLKGFRDDDVKPFSAGLNSAETQAM
ncbi:uncharacterized protein [Arachis hypogaea]|uniref:uncharacterized protein n=1 Tax=Arachis hypogaea TaxID=3818 RepID=UPI003B21C772